MSLGSCTGKDRVYIREQNGKMIGPLCQREENIRLKRDAEFEGSAEPESEEAPLIQARRTDTWNGLEVDMAETTFEATTTSAFELPTTTEVATTATTSDGAEMRDNRSEDYLSDDYNKLVDPDSGKFFSQHIFCNVADMR